MYPGDILHKGQISTIFPYRQSLKDGHLNHLIDVQYPEEMSGLRSEASLGEHDINRLQEAMEQNITDRAALYGQNILEKIRFCIEILDIDHDNGFNIRFQNKNPSISRSKHPAPDGILTMQTTSKILHYSFASEWGGDAIGIGYGCKIHILDKDIIRSGRHRICVHLLTRHPKIGMGFRRDPLRTARALLHNPGLRLRYTNRLRRKKTVDMLGSHHWLLHDKKDICHTYQLPVLNEDVTDPA